MPRFERIGLLWLGDHWHRVEAATFLALLPAGALAGALALALLWRRRDDAAAVWRIGLGALALAAVWRTIVHPPSGDEPSLLLAGWQWLHTGSADLGQAWEPRAADWSGAAEFRDTLVREHTIGPPDGRRYTYHGILLPPALGLLLWPFGRFGLALALVGVAALAARWTLAAAAAAAGRPASAWLTAVLLLGSPLAPYTIFFGPDLPAAALMALGALGLATGRVGPVAVAAAALPWVHHKCVILAGGLVCGAWALGPGAGASVTAALLASLVPEAAWLEGKVGFSLLSPGAVLATHATLDATWTPVNWLRAAPGLLADRYAGLIWYPAWALAAAGCGWAARRGGPGARAVLVAGAPFLLALLSFNMWSGGTGAPGRQLVALVPVLAVGLAVLDARLPAGGPHRRWLAAAGWAGIAATVAILFVPALAFESAKLKLEAAATARIGLNPLAVLPAVARGESLVAAVPWLAALGAGWVLLYRRIVR